MRGSASCVIVVRRFGVWRMFVGAVAALVAWACLAPGAQAVGVRVAVALAGVAVGVLALSLLRVPAASFRWDGSGWACSGAATPSSAPIPGVLDVAIDLGSFMLLRFASGEGARRRSVRWTPVERRGLEREWHSFRCAVYSPRPAAGTAGAAPFRLP
jgi:hypothetical protein